MSKIKPYPKTVYWRGRYVMLLCLRTKVLRSPGRKQFATEHFSRGSRRVGVLCNACGWRGYRRLFIDKDLGHGTAESTHPGYVTDCIKGQSHEIANCPQCRKHSVVMTHMT